MSLAMLYSRAQSGIDAPLVTVEAHLSNGLPALSIVGLPEMAVRESKDRVRGALINSRFEFPLRRITINLAPADLPKEGGRFDLSIALGILAASGQIPEAACQRFEFLGELALSGELRPVRGVLPAALQARKADRALIAPALNGPEAALVEGLEVYTAEHLLEVCGHLTGQQRLPVPDLPPEASGYDEYPDMEDVKGQAQPKRALEIAAAGQHSLLLIGPPGSGKSMLANRLPGILPPLDERQALAAAAVRSVSEGGFSPRDWKRRPFRAPHHTASAVALVGGGSNPRPGEVSLATEGVLFLDELPEYERRVLEVLREPLENGHITISRAARQADFPARFQLVAAMNPCPCGYLGDTGGRACRCTQEQVARYRARISGPLLDRIDMHVEVPRLPPAALEPNSEESAETSARVRARVLAARRRQGARGGLNNDLKTKELERYCALDAAASTLLRRAMEKLGLSARAYHRILRVARTIADLADAEHIATAHLSEAIGYRRLDRNH